jgi:hypothetical protein
MGRQTRIPASLFEAVRDGKMRQAQAAREAGVTRQAFEQAYRTFRVQRLREQSGWLPAARVAENDRKKRAGKPPR